MQVRDDAGLDWGGGGSKDGVKCSDCGHICT